MSSNPGPGTKPRLTTDHLFAARLCRDVYDEAVESLETFVESKDTGTQATISLVDRRAIVCFRGSDEATDWKNNFDVGMIPFISRRHPRSEKKVHSGFFVSHNSIKGKVYKKLNSMIDSGDCESVLFCGHSLGASLSNIAIWDFDNVDEIPMEVVTFGSPRIGNKDFSEEFNKEVKCTRIVNDRDIVCQAPFTFMGYHHVGDTIHMRDDEEVSGDLGFATKFFWGFLGFFNVFEYVQDHDMDSYISSIEKCLEKSQ